MVRQRLASIAIIVLCATSSFGQYAPQANNPGSTAIHKNSSTIKSWANTCTVDVGYVDISDPSQGRLPSGNDHYGSGMADNLVVSLGDGGVATLTFNPPISNGQGFDFVVFENGFPNPANAAEGFLELAKVSVSSNGIDFYEFPSHSLTPTDVQIAGSGVYMLAEKINNLAGKYIAPYGVPFDLDELKTIANLDVSKITHVRITDVVGTIDDKLATYDSYGNMINDPYPTPFAIGGFDLDAVGAINILETQGIDLMDKAVDLSIYPTQASRHIKVIHKHADLLNYTIFSIEGQFIQKGKPVNSEIEVSELCSGHYLIYFTDENNQQWTKRFYKN